jgi:hypothetical protein
MRKTYHSDNQYYYTQKWNKGVCLQNIFDYSPFGVTLDGRTMQGDGYRYGFNTQEKVDEISGSGNHFTALFWEYDTRLGRRWNIDPAFEEKPWISVYHSFSNKPILNIDPSGANDDEYDKDGNKISKLGGNEIDFYHQKNGDTKVIDKKTGASNIIKGGQTWIKDYTHRSKDISWAQLTFEWNYGTGPTKSLISDFSNTTMGAFGSLNSAFSSFASRARKASLNSKELKGIVVMNYFNINPLNANDMWEQMWGRSNVSWYKLGDKTLFLMIDSKSMESFGYRMLNSWERSLRRDKGNTYQTYIWTETNSEVQNKEATKIDYDNRMYEKILRESRYPKGPKY